MEDIVQGSDGYFTVYVKNFVSKKKCEIEEYFSQFGTIVSIRTLEKDPRLAFVRYMYKEEVVKCFKTTKNDPIYQVSMANTRPRGGNTAGGEQPHVKPCGINQPVSEHLQPQDKEHKATPSGETDRDKEEKATPSGETERDKAPKSTPSGHTEKDQRRKPRPCRGTGRYKAPESTPSGDTVKGERQKARSCGGPVREENWETLNNGNEEKEENWGANTNECENSIVAEASGRTSGDHPVIDIVAVANLPDDIRPRDIYMLCYDADPLFVSPFKRVESVDNTLYCIVHLDKGTADELVKKLDGKVLKEKQLIALRLEK